MRLLLPNVDDLSPGLSIIAKSSNKTLTLSCIHNMLCLMHIKKSRWPEIGHWQLVFGQSHFDKLKVVVT